MFLYWTHAVSNARHAFFGCISDPFQERELGTQHGRRAAWCVGEAFLLHFIFFCCNRPAGQELSEMFSYSRFRGSFRGIEEVYLLKVENPPKVFESGTRHPLQTLGEVT